MLEWWRKRRAFKDFEESVACEAIHLELMEAKLKLRYRRLQLRILKLQEKDLKRRLIRKPTYVR